MLITLKKASALQMPPSPSPPSPAFRKTTRFTSFLFQDGLERSERHPSRVLRGIVIMLDRASPKFTPLAGNVWSEAEHVLPYPILAKATLQAFLSYRIKRIRWPPNQAFAVVSY